MACVKCIVVESLVELSSSETRQLQRFLPRGVSLPFDEKRATKLLDQMAKSDVTSNVQRFQFLCSICPTLRKKFAALGITQEQIRATDFDMCLCPRSSSRHSPGSKEASKTSARREGALSMHLHHLNWQEFDTYLHRFLTNKADADSRSLSIIYSVEKDRCNRGNLVQALSLMEDNERIINRSSIPVIMRSLVARASIHFLLKDYGSADNSYESAMQLAVAFPESANIKRAYLKVMLGLHFVLHKRDGDQFGQISEAGWSRAQSFFEEAAEEHMQWCEEMEKADFDNGEKFVSWVLTKLSFTLLRSCVKGHSLASQYRPPDRNMIEVKGVLQRLKQSVRSGRASPRLVVGYSMLRCDFNIRMAQFQSSEELRGMHYNIAIKHAYKAKEKSRYVPHSKHMHLAEESIDRRLQFINEENVHFFDKDATLVKQSLDQGEGTSNIPTLAHMRQERYMRYPEHTVSDVMSGQSDDASGSVNDLSFPSPPPSLSDFSSGNVFRQTYSTTDVCAFSSELESLSLTEAPGGPEEVMDETDRTMVKTNFLKN